MSTIEFLKQLDYDQLVFARNKAQELIDQKASEKKVKLWQVSDGFAVYGSFLDKDYLGAVKLLVYKAEAWDKIGRRENLEIKSIKVFESEVNDYIEG